MRVKSKPLDEIALDALGLELKSHREVLAVSPPPTRSSGVKLDSVEELLNKLKFEAKVL